eukprot:7385169-Prymnesium_polylepis.1
MHLRVQLAQARHREGVCVRREDRGGKLLLLRLHAMPEGGKQRVRIAHDLRLERALAALQEVRDAFAPRGEVDAVERVEVHLLERVHPCVRRQLAAAGEADVDELPAVNGLPSKLGGGAQEAERAAHAALVRLGHLLVVGLVHVAGVALLLEQHNLLVVVDLHCGFRGDVRAEAVNDLQHPPVRHVGDHGEGADAVGHPRGELDPRILRHVARQRHRDRRALCSPVLLEKLVREGALSPHARRQEPCRP